MRENMMENVRMIKFQSFFSAEEKEEKKKKKKKKELCLSIACKEIVVCSSGLRFIIRWVGGGGAKVTFAMC